MKTEKFTIEKTTIECFKMRSPSGTWADISIDANGKAGRIQIASDYGSWQFYWGACGCEFKEFLCGLDKHYVAGKFGASKWFDSEKTLSEYRAVIKENFNDGYINKEVNDDALAELQQLDGCNDRGEFCRILNDCDEIMRIYDHCPALVYGIDPGFENFWTKIWPRFIEYLKTKP
jgi:hypothetical protein